MLRVFHFFVFLFLLAVISSRFHIFSFLFFLVSFLYVIVSSNVFIVDYISLLHCFFTVAVVTASATDLREPCLVSGVFYLQILSHIWHSLLLLRLPWGWQFSLQGCKASSEIQTRPICLFQSLSVRQLCKK